MWPKRYKDYPPDEPLIKEPVYPGNGIVGCEMHEYNSWGTLFHRTNVNKKKKRSFFEKIKKFFSTNSFNKNKGDRG